MFVALSRFTVSNDMVKEVRSAFKRRPHLVDTALGFLGMEVMSPADRTAEIWLLTRWTDENSYRAWHRGHEYHEAHKGIPKGLKLVRGSSSVTLFEVFAEWVGQETCTWIRDAELCGRKLCCASEASRARRLTP